MIRRLGILSVVAFTCLLAVPAFAASQNAVVYGTVYNNSGTPMAGVTVTLANADLGISRTATSASDGSYDFAEVPPAEDYVITATQAGRVLDIRAGVTVNVGDERVILPPLKEQFAAAPPAPAVAPTATATATTGAAPATGATAAAPGSKPPTPGTTTAATTGSKPAMGSKPVTVASAGQPAIKVMTGQVIRNETISTAVSGVITGEQMRSLPLYNRNFLSLGALTPNTHDAEQGSELAGASFSVAGQRPSANNFLLDGSDNVASSSNQAVPFQVNEAVQEFRVISSTAPAEYGRNQGGVVNIVTRRATNSFHGALFGYWGWDGFNASNPLSAYTGTTFDRAAAYAGPVNSAYSGTFPLTYNDWVSSGAALAVPHCADSIGAAATATATVACGTGGFGAQTRFDPASILSTRDSHLIPFESEQFGGNLGFAPIKDKLFLFGSYEGTIIDNPTPIFERVPSSFDRTYNPPLAGGVPNSGAFNFTNADPSYSLSQGIFSLFPRSNVVAVPGVLEFFQGQAPNYTTVHNYLGRADIVQSSATSWNLRYVAQMLNQLHDDTLPSNPAYPGNGAYRDVFNQNTNISYTHSFSRNIINQISVGFNRFNVKETPQDESFDARTIGFLKAATPTLSLNGVDLQSSGQTPFTGTNGPQHSGIGTSWRDCCRNFPTMDYLFPFARIGAPVNAPSKRIDTTIFAGDSFSWSKGKHGIKAGFGYRHLENEVGNSGLSRDFIYSSNLGEFTSDSESCNGSCAGNAFRRPSFDFAQTQAPYSGTFNSFVISAYLQDTWRFHPRWTLNYGIRYEYFSVPEADNNNLWNYDPKANGLIRQGSTTALDPYGDVCGTAPTTYASLPGSVAGTANVGFTTAASALPKGWNCTSGTSEIAHSNHANFAPRVGVAWDISGSGKTVLRVGYGLDYDQSPVSYTSQLLMNRPTTTPNALFGQVFIPGGTAGFCNSVAGSGAQCGVGSSILSPTVQAASFDGVNPNTLYSAATQPFAVYARDAGHSATPYTSQISGSLQQTLGNKVGVEFGYVGARGYNLPVVYNANFSREWDTKALFSDPFAFTPILTQTNQGSSQYDSFSARTRVADFHGLRANFTYSYARSSDNASNSVYPNLPITGPNTLLPYQFFQNGSRVPGCLYDPASSASCPTGVVPVTPTIDFSGGAVTTTGSNPVLVSRYLLPQDPFHFLTNDYGPSDFDSHNKFVVDYVWEIPNTGHSGTGKVFLNNWQISGIYTFQSGQPFSVFAGPVLGEITQRANATGAVNQDNNNPNGAISFTGFSLAAAGPDCSTGATGGYKLVTSPNTACIGNSGRNAYVGPHYNNLNLAIQKGFHLFGEGRTLIFRSEFYNIVNTSNFYNPISTISLSGSTLYGNFGKIKSAHDPRQVQFAVRFTW